MTVKRQQALHVDYLGLDSDLLQQLRGFKSDITLVMFKLESQIDRDELHRRARRTMARAGADFIVANRLEDVTADHHRADLLTATDATPLEGRAAIACGLIDVLTARGKS